MPSKKKLKRELRKADALIKELNRTVNGLRRNNHKLAVDAGAIYHKNQDYLEAIRLTQEYIQLPPRKGWSWFDVLSKHEPVLAARMKAAWEANKSRKMNKSGGKVTVLTGLDFSEDLTPDQRKFLEETLQERLTALIDHTLEEMEEKFAPVQVQQAHQELTKEDAEDAHVNDKVAEQLPPSTHCPDCGSRLPGVHNRGCNRVIVSGKKWPPETMETKRAEEGDQPTAAAEAADPDWHDPH